MIEEAKMILQQLQKRGFTANYIGGKCRVELHNRFRPEEKLKLKDIDIVTDATNDDIKKLFPNHNERGEIFKVIAVKFGGYDFEIATYRKDVYNQAELKTAKKIVKPAVDIAKDLDEDRARRDFTINAVAQDIDGEYIDYVYVYRNKKVSAMDDIKSGILRAIGNPKQRFEEDPLRIVRLFRFLSQTGYEIEKQTLKAVVANLKLCENIPHERFGPEMNKLLAGRYASAAIQMMQEIGFFDLQIKNGLKGIKNDFAAGLKAISPEYLNVIDIFNNNAQDSSTIELWALLLKPLGVERARETLESFYPISKDDIERVEWLIENFMIIEEEDLRNKLFEARTGIIKRLGLHCMRDLLAKIGKIHVTLYRDLDHVQKSKRLIDTFCMRPYFHEQLRVTGDEMMAMADKEAGPWINTAKEKLLYKLINAKRVPVDDEYMKYVKEAIDETIMEA